VQCNYYRLVKIGLGLFCGSARTFSGSVFAAPASADKSIVRAIYCLAFKIFITVEHLIFDPPCMSCFALQAASNGVRQEWNSQPTRHVDDDGQPQSGESSARRRQRRYSSPGEELVYREMIEHKARDLELRQHWKQVYCSYFLSVFDFQRHCGGYQLTHLPINHKTPDILRVYAVGWAAGIASGL